MLLGLGRGPPGRAMSAGLGRPPGRGPPPGRGAPGRGPPGPAEPGPAGPPGPGWPGRGAPRWAEPMPEATGAYGLLPGRGPGRGPERPPGRGAAGRGPDCPAPRCPPAPPCPPEAGRGAAGRGPGTGPRPGAAGPGAPWVGTGGTGGGGDAAGVPGAAAAGRTASPPDGAVGGDAAAPPDGACGRMPAGPGAAEAAPGAPPEPAAGAGACGRAGPGRGAAGRPPLPSAPRLPSAPGPRPTGADWPCGLLPCVLGLWAVNESLSLRTTGASIVEDAERTNSPISWSLAITALLSTPNSFASSYTRTFATALPLSARLRPGPSWPVRCSVLRPTSVFGSHRRVLIARSSQLIPLSRHCCRSAATPPTRASRAGSPAPGRSGRWAPSRPDFALPSQVARELAGTKRSRCPQRPREYPAALRQLEAFLAGVQVRAPAGQPRLRVRDNVAPNRHQAQQVRLNATNSAAYTRADR